MDLQDKSATQKLIDEHFNTQLLRHSVFYGQNDITAILEVRTIAEAIVTYCKMWNHTPFRTTPYARTTRH